MERRFELLSHSTVKEHPVASATGHIRHFDDLFHRQTFLKSRACLKKLEFEPKINDFCSAKYIIGDEGWTSNTES